MSTNYYLRRKICPSKLKKIKGLVTEKNIYDGTLKEALEEFHEIHIGKSSAGWQFLFNHNEEKYYSKSYASINKFLQDAIKEGGHFVDEYGKEVSLTDFWEMVDSKKEGFDLESYYQHELKRWEEYQQNPLKFNDCFCKPSKPEGYNIYKESFSEDNWHLRFSAFTEFS